MADPAYPPRAWSKGRCLAAFEATTGAATVRFPRRTQTRRRSGTPAFRRWLWGMDQELERRHLRKAEVDIAEAWRRIDQQRSRVARLAADGHDTATGEALLATMIESAEAMEEHRQTILRELGQ